jgi:uncharacterized membrane protein
MKRLSFLGADKELFITLVFSSLVSVLLLIVRVLVTGSPRLTFLVWNLVLAWIPLLFAWVLYRRHSGKQKPEWKDLAYGVFWLAFLPNSFYIITDLIHLQSSGEVSLLYDTAMITSFVLNGLLLGYISLYMIQKIVARLFDVRMGFIVAQIVLLLSAFAIYLGRYLRWNTWDIVVNPLGLAFDVSDRIINPGSYRLTFIVTGVYFLLLSATYVVLYRLAGILSKNRH